MFVVLLEATTQAVMGRTAGDRHLVMAIVDGEESTCAQRATAELARQGWTAIECKRHGRLATDIANSGQISAALADAIASAEETGLAFVIYEKTTRPS
jgi:hypothetical protein